MEIEREEQLSDPPLIHYLKRGYKDKTLLPNLVFDPTTYRESNSIEFSGAELTHYCLTGDRLGYLTHPLFSAKAYNAARTDDLSRCTAIEHFLGSATAARHVSHPTIDRPLPQEVLEFVRQVYSDDRGMRPQPLSAVLSRPLSPERRRGTASLSWKTDARRGDWALRGHSPGAVIFAFVTCRSAFIRMSTSASIPTSELPAVKPDFFPAFCHYMEFGRSENRTIGKWQFHLDAIDLRIPTSASPVALDASAARIDVCVLMHFFYPDLWPELAAFARNFESVSRDVFVNIVDIAWTPRFQRELRELCPGAFVQLSNDNGRDIGGFTRLLDNVDIKKYDLFAFMHSKKSPHIAAEKGDYWRRSLLRAFAGSPDYRRRVRADVQG